VENKKIIDLLKAFDRRRKNAKNMDLKEKDSG
jgi:hypothetical protein